MKTACILLSDGDSNNLLATLECIEKCTCLDDFDWYAITTYDVECLQLFKDSNICFNKIFYCRKDKSAWEHEKFANEFLEYYTSTVVFFAGETFERNYLEQFLEEEDDILFGSSAVRRAQDHDAAEDEQCESSSEEKADI